LREPCPDVRTWLRDFLARARVPRGLRWDPSLAGETGAGIRIGLVDSGVRWAHPVFAGARLRGRDFTGSSGLGDPSGHGTSSAALLVGQGGGWPRGLCPDSELLFAKALGLREREASVRAIAQAIRWLSGQGAQVLVLPFGSCQGAPLITRELRRAVERGCQVLAAAGNRGPDVLAFPARLPEVMAVSGLWPDGAPLPFCCARDEVALYAPGHEVPTVGAHGPATLSGSSPAAVLAAGLMALELSRHRARQRVGGPSTFLE
jgi:subtilisin family serine protease